MTTRNSPFSVRAMIFIDAGYFTEHWVENECKIPKTMFNFGDFSKWISGKTSFPELDTVRLIRTYYYDGLPEPRHNQKYKEQTLFHDYLNYTFPNYEVRTGQLIKRNGEWVQKGVDAILALDMIDKAYTDQYDVAILVGGDLDHFPAVQTVKNIGKEVYGVYYGGSFSQKLINEFDLKHILDKKNEGGLALHKPFFQNYKDSLTQKSKSNNQ